MKKFFLIAALLVLAAPLAFAGSCPTGANYGPNGNQTLAAIGVSSCFYASASGSDCLSSMLWCKVVHYGYFEPDVTRRQSISKD